MSSQGLSRSRCFNHASREAVARCPECTRFYCRECITEHDDQVICASCLRKETDKPKKSKSALVAIVRTIQGICGFIFLWVLFTVFGEILLKMPSSFHEGTLWQYPAGWR